MIFLRKILIFIFIYFAFCIGISISWAQASEADSAIDSAPESASESSADSSSALPPADSDSDKDSTKDLDKDDSVFKSAEKNDDASMNNDKQEEGKISNVNVDEEKNEDKIRDESKNQNEDKNKSEKISKKKNSDDNDDNKDKKAEIDKDTDKDDIDDINVAENILEEKNDSKGKIFSLEDELYITDKNEYTGIYDRYYSLNKDSNRYSMSASTDIDVLKFKKIYGGDFGYARNLDVFWLETLLSLDIVNFNEVTNTASRSSINPSAEENNKRSSDIKQSIISVGLGISYRFMFPYQINIFNVDNLFHTTTCYINYSQVGEDRNSSKYLGPGLRADYGIHKRVSSKMHLGLKFTYRFSEVIRKEKFQDENNNDRRLFMSWGTFGFDLAYYF
ncbi:MAG: hypothetical protein HQK51_00335 [Oligoflexia bacterium]|nr:hypothetical protein [Oligoflexia bacterium]